jgi:hypothetical protein
MNAVSQGGWWMSMAMTGAFGPAAQTAGAGAETGWKLRYAWTCSSLKLRAQA